MGESSSIPARSPKPIPPPPPCQSQRLVWAPLASASSSSSLEYSCTLIRCSWPSETRHAPLPDPQLLFLAGLSIIIGLKKTLAFFFQRHKLKGTSLFLRGVVIVLLRWPLLGMCLETYRFFSLFK
ncbi:hypothetical protein HPG69_005319 [Diceros bicornis minor]|uniref:Uncharacterized protein n=1 Tax=Diceros bicornis minor TaxID=77932 RepID=A0A7J7ELN0_DICBM|nr:hypothetical protein HPG69_005319 [Diceros bicornis minor]